MSGDDNDKYFHEDYQQQFQYLPYLFFYVLFVLLGVFLINKCLFDRKKFLSKGYDDNYLGEETTVELCLSYIFNMFCCCVKPCCGGRKPVLLPSAMFLSFFGTIIAFLLALFRLLCCAAILIFSILMEFPEESHPLRRFSSWNNIIACIFFFLVTVLSCGGLVSKVFQGRNGIKWSLTFEKMSAFSLVLYEVATANSLFISIVAYTWHQQSRNFFVHLLPTICVFIELVMNKAPFRFEHYYYTLMLPIAYLLFQWGMVYDEQMPWQYSFLKVDSKQCFYKYSILFLIHLACYYVFALLNFAKESFFGVKYEDRHRIAEEYSDDEDDSYVSAHEAGGIEIILQEEGSPTAPPRHLEEKDDDSYDYEAGNIPMAEVISAGGKYSTVASQTR